MNFLNTRLFASICNNKLLTLVNDFILLKKSVLDFIVVLRISNSEWGSHITKL